MGEYFTLARLFFATAGNAILDGSAEMLGAAFDKMSYSDKVSYNDGLRAVFRAAEANPELARGLK